MTTVTAKQRFFFRIQMSVRQATHNNLHYVSSFVSLYKTQTWNNHGLDCKSSDEFATIRFTASEIKDGEDYQSKLPTKYQPRHFSKLDYLGSDMKFGEFYQVGIDIHSCMSLDKIADYGKDLSAIVTKVSKSVEEYNLRHVHNQCEFGLLVDALLKSGIGQIVSNDRYDLYPTDDKKCVWMRN